MAAELVDGRAGSGESLPQRVLGLLVQPVPAALRLLPLREQHLQAIARVLEVHLLRVGGGERLGLPDDRLALLQCDGARLRPLGLLDRGALGHDGVETVDLSTQRRQVAHHRRLHGCLAKRPQAGSGLLGTY